jgi:hypothetical protein
MSSTPPRLNRTQAGVLNFELGNSRVQFLDRRRNVGLANELFWYRRA